MLKLDLIDRRLLFELERNARSTDTTLARLVRKSPDAVRYRIQRLEREGIITRWKSWVDFSKLGYSAATLVLKTLALPKRRASLIAEASADPLTYWLGTAEGSWNISISRAFHSNSELFNYKLKLLSNYNDFITDCVVTLLVSVAVHDKYFLSEAPAKFNLIAYEPQRIKFDKISVGILSLLYGDCRLTLRALAEQLEVSVDQVRNRLALLEQQQVIARHSIGINYNLLGYELFKTCVYLRSTQQADLAKMLKFIEAHPVFTNVVKQIAPWDFEIVSFAHSAAHYHKELEVFVQRFEGLIDKVESASMNLDLLYPCKTLPRIEIQRT